MLEDLYHFHVWHWSLELISLAERLEAGLKIVIASQKYAYQQFLSPIINISYLVC